MTFRRPWRLDCFVIGEKNTHFPGIMSTCQGSGFTAVVDWHYV
jgi:hypothetical protein